MQSGFVRFMRRGAVALAFLVSLSSAAQAACSRAALPAAAAQPVRVNAPDQALFNAAVLAEVNYQRCLKGLRPVRADASLMRAAYMHSNWMASAGKLEHRSNVRGMRSLADRLNAADVSYRTAAENIGMVHRFRIDEGQRFFVRNTSACHFVNASGNRIAPYSYGTLAQRVVVLWMESPGHRRNILDRNMNKMGAALGFDNDAQYCGQFYMTQNFAG